MPLDFEKVQGNVVFVRMSGKLHDADYKQSFLPVMEDLFKKWGTLRILFIMEEGFAGWDMHGAWDELKFELKHMHDVIKVGVVGEEKWEGFMAKLSRLYTRANVRFFPAGELADAREWITSGF